MIYGQLKTGYYDGPGWGVAMKFIGLLSDVNYRKLEISIDPDKKVFYEVEINQEFTFESFSHQFPYLEARKLYTVYGRLWIDDDCYEVQTTVIPMQRNPMYGKKVVIRTGDERPQLKKVKMSKLLQKSVNTAVDNGAEIQDEAYIVYHGLGAIVPHDEQIVGAVIWPPQ